jgi:hypothetical protein
LKVFFQAGAETIGATKVAGHVLADAQVRFGRWRQAQMRIEAGYSMEAIKRYVNSRRQGFQLLGRQITELTLNSPQLIENQRHSPRTGRSMIPSVENKRGNDEEPPISDIANPCWQVHIIGWEL